MISYKVHSLIVLGIVGYPFLAFLLLGVIRIADRHEE